MSSTCVLSHHNSNTINTTPIHPALRPSTANTTQSTINMASTTSTNSVEDSANRYQSANEILHDTVTLLSGNNGPRHVILSVFRTTVDHFALVYPDNRRKAVAIKPAGCINLRGVTCEETVLGAGLKGFTLRPKKSDTSTATLTFLCSDLTMLPKWLDALSSVPIASPVKSNDDFMESSNCYNNKYSRPNPPPMRRSSPRQSSLSSLDEEDEE